MLQTDYCFITNLVEICDRIRIFTSYTELHGGGTESHRGLPISMQVFFQLRFGTAGGFEHFGFEHSFFLKGCYVFANAIIEYRIIAFGNEFVYFGGELFYFAQLQANGFFLILCRSGFYTL